MLVGVKFGLTEEGIREGVVTGKLEVDVTEGTAEGDVGVLLRVNDGVEVGIPKGESVGLSLGETKEKLPNAAKSLFLELLLLIDDSCSSASISLSAMKTFAELEVILLANTEIKNLNYKMLLIKNIRYLSSCNSQ